MVLTTTVIKTKLGYKGKVTAYDKGRYLWSITNKTTRKYKKDAKSDAKFMKKSLENR